MHEVAARNEQTSAVSRLLVIVDEMNIHSHYAELHAEFAVQRQRSLVVGIYLAR